MRDPAADVNIQLRLVGKSLYTVGMPRDVRRKSGLFGIGRFLTVQAGRPDHLQKEYGEIADVARTPRADAG
ncbi:hypothetical protein [Streptomyces sp. NPDC001435]|uniref:hypothetical protein n=1 Tax=unclassified Streptomyces TaxID=2593676 RepID=UPI0036A20B6C